MSISKSNYRLVLVGPLIASLATGLLACTPATPPGATASGGYGQQGTAKVVSIDRAGRRITVQDPDGQTATFPVSKAVQNFDQISVGDTVSVDYQQWIDVRVAGKVAPMPGVLVQAAATGAPKGQKPAGTITLRTQRSVQILSVDKTTHTVTFRESDGSLDSFVVQNPENFAFADGLAPGTIVDVMNTTTVAISVKKL